VQTEQELPVMDQDTAYTVSAFSLRLTRFFIWLLLWYALVQRSLPLIAVSAGVLIIAYGTLLWSRFALKNLEADLVPSSTRMFPGDTCTVVLVLKNWKMLPVWVELGINAHAQVQMENSGQLKTSLLPHEERRIVRQLTMEKRGVYPLGSAGLAAGDMLGLNSRSKTYPFPRELIVYPRKREALFPTLQFQEFFGQVVTKELVEDPCWYAGTRKYTGTLPARFIHWKASARLGELQEKIFDSTSHRSILLVLDVRGFTDAVRTGAAADEYTAETAEEGRATGTAAELEELIQATAALASVLMQNGSSFSLAVNARLTGDFSPVLPIERGPEHLGMVLELLARAETKTVRDFLPMTSRPEFRGAGIAYFGYMPPESAISLFGIKLLCCTYAHI